MSREPRLDAASSKEPEVDSPVQKGPCQPSDAGPNMRTDDKKTNEERHVLNSFEKVKNGFSDKSISKKKSFLKTVMRSVLFSIVVLFALTPPISTVGAIIFGSIYGFSWILVFIPLLTWILTGLLTVRLMIYKTGITFKKNQQ